MSESKREEIMAVEEAKLIASWLQYVAGGGFVLWMASSFVSIAIKIRGNGKTDSGFSKHAQETHDTLGCVERVEKSLETLGKEAVKHTGLLGTIAANGKK